MAGLTREEALHVARLAALELREDEVAAVSAQLGAFLEHVSDLRALDLQAVEPTAHPLPLGGTLRPDEVRPSMPREAYLAAAPASADGGFAVPLVLDGEA